MYWASRAPCGIPQTGVSMMKDVIEASSMQLRCGGWIEMDVTVTLLSTSWWFFLHVNEVIICWINLLVSCHCFQDMPNRSHDSLKTESHHDANFVLTAVNQHCRLSYWQWCTNRPIAQFPQCTSPLSHNAPFCNRNVHVCTFLLQKGAFWDIYRMHCGFCQNGL